MSSNGDVTAAERHLHEGLAFFGAITASVTHELNNVLGTVDQITGLLEDLAYALSQGEEITSERLNAIVERTNKQTERGAALIKQLNLFAHSADNVVAEFSLNDTLQNLVALMNRLAQMQRTELTLTLPDKDITIKADRFMILQTVFHLIKRMISIASRDTLVEVIVSEQGSDISVSIRSPYEGTVSESFDRDHVCSLAEMLSGQVDEVIDDKCAKVEFRFPAICEK